VPSMYRFTIARRKRRNSASLTTNNLGIQALLWHY
jgi:hypothetical protein